MNHADGQTSNPVRAARRLRMTYLLALGCLALLMMISVSVLRSSLHDQAESARFINDSGKQRMRSQQIATRSMTLAHAVRMGDEELIRQAGNRLDTTVENWSDEHAALSRAANSLPGAGDSSLGNEFTLLAEDVRTIRDEVAVLLALANATELDASESERRALAIVEAADRFLPAMNTIVVSFTERVESREHSAQIKEILLALGTLVVLVLEALLVFEPATRTVRRSMENAEEAARLKSEFLANMSHEIRTPMTAIIGYTDILETEGLIKVDRPGAREAVSTIRSNGNHLLSIINDILDVSKIEAGKISVDPVRSRAHDIVAETVSMMMPRALEKGLTISAEYESEIPVSIVTDPTRVRQVLINLVTNAIKFTESGEILIRVAYDHGANSLLFRVEDQGIGLTPEHLDALRRFEAFAQADASVSRRFGGTGLGLRISYTLARMLGGDLTVESEFGKGSVFTLSINVGIDRDEQLFTPCARGVRDSDGPSNGSEQHAVRSVESLKGVRILVAEDGPDNQRLFRHHLEKAGAVLVMFDNGRCAYEHIADSEKRPVDVVLMDMQMPEMDGYTAVKRLRHEGFDLPIIALTAHAMPEDRQKCLRAGCDDYMTKPIDRAVLIERCAAWAKRRAAEAA